MSSLHEGVKHERAVDAASVKAESNPDVGNDHGDAGNEVIY